MELISKTLRTAGIFFLIVSPIGLVLGAGGMPVASFFVGALMLGAGNAIGG